MRCQQTLPKHSATCGVFGLSKTAFGTAKSVRDGIAHADLISRSKGQGSDPAKNFPDRDLTIAVHFGQQRFCSTARPDLHVDPGAAQTIAEHFHVFSFLERVRRRDRVDVQRQSQFH